MEKYKKNKEYSPIRNYKKFKKDYPYFVLFIKNKNYYWTFDSDAKIMMYLLKDYKDDLEYKINKEDFSKIVKMLHDIGINVALAGWKLVNEYYTDKMSEYLDVKKKARIYFKSTKSSFNK